MSFASTTGSITQSDTDTDLSGMDGLTGVTTIIVGDVTLYVIADRNLVITGTCTMDPTLEMVFITSTSVGNALYINGGTLNIGSVVSSAFGTASKPLYQPATAFVLGVESTAATSGYCINVTSTGTLNWYGAIISVNSSQLWAEGSTIVIREGVLFSRRFSTNNRIRISEGTNIDINGLTTYGIQADWLITENFSQFANYTALDKSIPTECALGDAGERAWKTFPDNSHASDASMSNWKGFNDITITNAEVGSRSLIVPDRTDQAVGSTFHGGRLYHEYTVACFDVLNVGIEGAIVYLKDYNNGLRVTTDSTGTGVDIDEESDQVLTPSTDSDGITVLQTLLTAMYYRTDDTSDITDPNGLERVDYRGKPYAVLCAVTGSSGVSGTFTSSDNSLPALPKFTRFILEGSTNNDTQTWVTTEDWTTSGGDADRLSSNSTDESENTMSMVVLGEDQYDVYVWAYGYLPYKFTNAVMNGLVQTDLVATLLEDGGITQANQVTVDAYTTLDNLNELYDAAMNYKCDSTNMDEPTIAEYIIQAIGNTLDLGDNDLVVNTGATGAFAYNGTDTITAKPTTELDVSSVKTNITTTGDITFTTASVGDDIVLTGTVYLDAAQDLDGVTINGDLYINTGANSTLTFTGVTVTGDVYNDATGNTLTINSTGGSSLTAGDAGDGNGETNIVQTVPLKVIVKDITTLGLIQGARVGIHAASGGDLPYEDTVTITRVTTTATVSHTAHGMKTGETIHIKGANQADYNGEFEITVTSVDAYTYTVANSPTTPATGTILATAALVNELTDVLGEVNETLRYTSDQPIGGTVRKATP